MSDEAWDPQSAYSPAGVWTATTTFLPRIYQKGRHKVRGAKTQAEADELVGFGYHPVEHYDPSGDDHVFYGYSSQSDGLGAQELGTSSL